MRDAKSAHSGNALRNVTGSQSGDLAMASRGGPFLFLAQHYFLPHQSFHHSTHRITSIILHFRTNSNNLLYSNGRCPTTPLGKVVRLQPTKAQSSAIRLRGGNRQLRFRRAIFGKAANSTKLATSFNGLLRVNKIAGKYCLGRSTLETFLSREGNFRCRTNLTHGTRVS
jgi:hypothetical protein